MTTFALVHGAWHNATCWHPTASVPRQPGHEVITMDLPCTDPAAGLEEYATTVLDAVAQVCAQMIAQPEALADALTSGLT